MHGLDGLGGAQRLLEQGAGLVIVQTAQGGIETVVTTAMRAAPSTS